MPYLVAAPQHKFCIVESSVAFEVFEAGYGVVLHQRLFASIAIAFIHDVGRGIVRLS